MKAAATGDSATIEKLLTAKPDLVNYRGKGIGLRPLHVAAHDGHTKVIEILLAKGAEVDAVTDTGETPLYSAAGQGRIEVVKVLVAKGANVNAKDRYGHTPLWSARNGLPNQEVIEFLRSHRATEGD